MTADMHTFEFPTPSLLVDLDVMESNLKRMADFFVGIPCKLRPHYKNTKCLALAEKQIDAGAIGITTATLRETEMLVNAGIKSILIANEVAGESNLKILAELAEVSTVMVAVDNEKVIKDIARISLGKKNKPALVVDVDLGLKRCGVLPGLPALDLAKIIVVNELPLAGLMGYEGHLQRMIPDHNSLRLRNESFNKLILTRNLIRQYGLQVNMISTGGTGTYSIASGIDGITEVQPGNYLLMDTSYSPYAPEFLPALSLLATVISVTPGERFILNAGIKEISAERGMPSLKNMPGAFLSALHAEHGIVEIQNPSLEVSVGDSVELSVYYSDGTVNLHRKMYGIRNGKVETIFSIAS